MAKYKVLRDTYSRDQYYTAGEIVEIADGVEVSRHFQRLDAKAAKAEAAKAEVQEPRTLHDLAKASVSVAAPGKAAKVEAKAEAPKAEAK